MKKTLQILTFMLVVLIASFLFTTKTKAFSQLVEQDIYTDELTHTGTDQLQDIEYFDVGWTTSTENLYSVQVKLKTNTHDCESAMYAVYYGCGSLCPAVRSENTPTIVEDVEGWYGYLFTTTTYEINDLYRLYISLDADSSGTCVGGSNNDGSVYGSNVSSSFAYGYHTPTTYINSDAGFSITVGSDLDLNPETSIVFTKTPTSTCDFENWPIQTFFSEEDLANIPGNGWSAQVLFGISPNSQSMYLQDNYGGLGSLSYPWHIPKESPLPIGVAWYAQASICSSSNPEDCEFWNESDQVNLIDTSEIWQFIILDETNSTCLAGQKVYEPGFLYPSATSTEASNNFTCDPNSDFFSNSLCRLFQYLFVPSNESLQNFIRLKERVQYKPPFGYFTVYSGAISNFENSTSTTSTIATTDLDYLTIWKNVSIFETIKDIFGYILWLIFIFWVFHRFRHLSLNE